MIAATLAFYLFAALAVVGAINVIFQTQSCALGALVDLHLFQRRRIVCFARR